MGNSTFVAVLIRIQRHTGILTQQLSSRFDQIDQSLNFLPEQKGQVLVLVRCCGLKYRFSTQLCFVSSFILCTASTLCTSQSPSRVMVIKVL